MDEPFKTIGKSGVSAAQERQDPGGTGSISGSDQGFGFQMGDRGFT